MPGWRAGIPPWWASYRGTVCAMGIGFIWISQTTSYVAWVIGFGVLVGIGIGFGYSCCRDGYECHEKKKSGRLCDLTGSWPSKSLSG